jgi:hypothetical protein
VGAIKELTSIGIRIELQERFVIDRRFAIYFLEGRPLNWLIAVDQ